MRSAFTLPLFALLLVPAPAAGAEEAPVVGRPADLPFSEANGRFEAVARAEPTALPAWGRLTLTVTVRAIGRVRHPPRPIDLAQVPSFAADFFIEDAPERAPPRKGAGEPNQWELVYRLKPKGKRVTEVPSFPFAFYNPEIQNAEKRFQVIYTDPIPLRVGALEAAPVPLRAPELAYVLASGPDLLAHGLPWQTPRPAELAAWLLAPPLASLACYLAWWRLTPQAARARRRRRRATRLALSSLQAAAALAPAACAERSARVVADYLRERYELPVAEPTPAEVAAHLTRQGCPAPLAEQAERFFRACDEARFRPGPSPINLVGAGTQFLLDVEALSCPPSS